MDAKTFDRITKTLGAGGNRRALLGGLAAIAGAAAVPGLRAAAQEELETAGDKCKGKSCSKNSNCGKGLICDQVKGKCEYKNGKHGKKGDTCCGSPECKGGLKCVNNTCKKNR